MVKHLVKIQDSYINTYHPDFMGGANSIMEVFNVNSHLAAQNLDQMNRANSMDFEEINN